jgi:hypothetical protein
MNKKNYSDKNVTRYNNNHLNNFLPSFLINDLNSKDLNITNLSNNFDYLDTSINSKQVNKP